MPIVWVLADDRPGNRAQCLGVADRLGVPYDIKEIRYTIFAGLPNVIRRASLLGVRSDSKAALQRPWPDIVIAAGRRTAPVARYIKARHPKARLVHLMWPDVKPRDFDCIVLPSHDREYGMKPGKDGKASDLPNVLRVLGAPHRITGPLLEEARLKWQRHLTSWPAPRIALLAGGDSKHGRFSTADWTRLGELATRFARNTKGSLLVTTSRRTGEQGEAALRAALSGTDHKFHGAAERQDENPYLGYLATADAVIVTADSIAMCSEACASGKPVYFFEPSILAGKHARFANTLIATGYVFPFTADFTDTIRTPLKNASLDSATTVADYVKKHFFKSA